MEHTHVHSMIIVHDVAYLPSLDGFLGQPLQQQYEFPSAEMIVMIMTTLPAAPKLALTCCYYVYTNNSLVPRYFRETHEWPG